MAKPKVVTSLKAGIKLKDGSTTWLKRGDEVPKDADPDSIERAERLGAFAPRPGDEGGDEPAPGPDANAGPAGVDIAAASEDDLKVYAEKATAAEVVEAATSVGLAERLLKAEKAGKNRKTAVEPLEAIIADGTPEGEANDPNTPPAPPE